MPNNFRPDHVSFSSLSLYENCPRCYFLQYVMGCYPEEKDAWRFGSAYHEGLAAYYGGGDFWDGFKSGLKKKMILGPIAYKFTDMAKTMWSHYEIFGEKFQSDKIEYSFKTPLVNPLTKEALEVPVKGVIDLITTDGRIVDHKTSSFLYEEQQSNPQLLIYSMIYRRLFSKAPKQLVFSVHMKENTIGRWQKVEFEPDEIAEAIQFKKIKLLLNGILSNQFDPKETKGWYFTHISLCPMYRIRQKKT